MCGIVGIIDFHNRVDAHSVRKSADVLYKRGPDDSGVWVEENVGLGHRRLAILDITSAGHQPMLSADGRYVIVYNGEIYNYRELRKLFEPEIVHWRSNSDTEVIIAAYDKWGVECLSHFRGMFAFAIWDRKKKSLFAARDRMGVKPFYYHYSQECFIFASRPRALFELRRGLSCEIDEQAVRLYIESGYVPAPYSVYKDIRKLPPAHYLYIDGNDFRIERYWEFSHIKTEDAWAKRNEADLLNELNELLSESVRYRMISDVSLGTFLSGGIDSSLITAIMVQNSSSPVKTFTIGFEDKRYNESGFAGDVAKYLGTEHQCEILSVNDLLNLMPLFLSEFDEPFFDSSALPTMAVSRLARKYVTVSLSGDGGDELFGGYHYYQVFRKISQFYKLPRTIRNGLAFLIGIIPEHQSKLLSAALKQPDILASFAFIRSITKDFCSGLFSKDISDAKSLYGLFSETSRLFPEGLSASELAMRLDALYTLPDDYLQKVDVASMAFSLESREPFLDHKLVEWAMKLPLKYKLHNGQNKHLLRELAYRYIPRHLVDRPKHGFEVPISSWLKGPLKTWAEERLNDSAVFKRIPLNQEKVFELYSLHNSGARDVHPLLWAILVLIEFDSNRVKNKD